MKNSTELKPSMGSATGIKRNSRWFRSTSQRGEIEQLFDLYWGGKERRITGMTLRIIGVNVIAVFALLLGVVYLGQYHAVLIEAKLERFETELLLVTAAISEGALIHLTEEDGTNSVVLSLDQARDLSARLAATIDQRIVIFNDQDLMIADSQPFITENSVKPIITLVKDKGRILTSVEVLKTTAGWIASFFPRYNDLLVFPGVISNNGADYVDVVDAKRLNVSVSAWRNPDGQVILSSAMPIKNEGKIVGIVLLVSDADDIKSALGDMWFNILKIFLLTLLITILISIYLSGVIARPLRKLADAAENVRRGKLKHTDIPDMSDRHDEIGELSVVLREMTNALWERMDTIESFAADVAHEIKNPLTSLKSAVETAFIVTKKEDLNKLLGVIQHDIERLDRLITDISKASRLDAELSREAFERVDLKQILHQLLDAYKNPLEREAFYSQNSSEALKDGVMITLDLPDHNNIFVLGSEIRLIQVFQNIIANALSFAPVKSIVKIEAEVTLKRVTIVIEDEGSGIPDGKLADIFERFYSERPNHEAYGRHSGLGLSICKQIITAHNGVIYAENKKDRAGNIEGARFVVILNIIP